MCGIIAIYSKNGVDARLDVPSALSSLSHRGPDGEGSWTCASKKAVLGHTRLSIMDPERGAQPMHLDHIHVAVNGEFYDFEEIRKELEQDGAKFTTDSDSEILLHLYRRYGIDCINRLSGEFSFVLWDENAGRIFAAQDRYGVKPLYYTVVDGSILFASEVKAIKALGTSLEWDEENVYNLAAGFVMDPRRTLFKNVYQVPAGHLMLASSGETRIQEYWNCNFDNDNIKKTSERESIELFDTALKTAVKRRLRADTPVGCYLSGGIDSSAVSAVASELHEQPVRAFTVSFADEMFDESRAAKQMAEKVGADYSAVHVTESDLADNYSKAI